jgi:hypothetical protein
MIHHLEAEKHAKVLAKIEKYKEDKILEELKIIELEKAKTERMLKIKREKERKRKAYIGSVSILSERFEFLWSSLLFHYFIVHILITLSFKTYATNANRSPETEVDTIP